MKYHRLIAVAVLWFAGTAQAFESQLFAADVPVFSGHMQTCFSHAMLGMDSVINARLGVPPEHVLALTASTTAGVQSFDEPVLSLMLTAYLWQGSPHSYAIQVFYECAAAVPVMVERSDFLP
jgi:hypothetical protein